MALALICFTRKEASVKGIHSHPTFSSYVWRSSPNSLTVKLMATSGFLLKSKEWHVLTYFFADDVILFVKANSKNIHSIHLTLQSFMASSGLNINLQKSSIWFSPNSSPHIIREASFVLGISQSSNPGSYLGFPLAISNRSSDYRFIKDKVDGRIDTWKSKYLSPMGKVVLLKSVCHPILAYFMQCLPFPKGGFCKLIDKSFRHFLWSKFDSKNKLHLVSWDTITKSTKEGGLGIHKSYERNLAFLGKLAWRLKSEPNLLWAKICLANYPLVSFKKSTIGKGLLRGQKIVDLGSKVVIHSGNNTNFWHDVWIDSGPVRNLIQGPLFHGDEHRSVSSFLREGNI